MLDFWAGYTCITWFGALTVPNQVIIEHIPYNLILTTVFNDTSTLITIILWDYLNLSLANEHVGDVTIPTHVIKYN
jgi:hypothetical protein